GDTRHQLGADGKKWSTNSTLRVLSYSPKVTASCIIQHPALRGEKLMASFHFQDLPSTEDADIPSPSENPAVSSLLENAAGTSPSASPEDPDRLTEHLTAQTSVTEQDPESKGIIRKEKNVLLPVLVAALIFVLLIIVLLFMVKLKKAHGVWKRENDVSEQTLESYKSRSNEDSPGHEKKGQ
ncbi:CRTAM protein, partial [Callaeas wilsoni]|nr:CRTAM protein [Callaeas wilsoni]